MSANDAGSGFAAMLLASAAARAADDPDPSAPGVAPLDEPPLTSSATGVASSLKALPAGGAATADAPASLEELDGGEEIGAGALGRGEAGALGAVERAEAEVASRAVVSELLWARPARLIIFHRLPSEADGPDVDADAHRRCEWLPQGVQDCFPPACPLPREDFSASSTLGAAPNAPLLRWAVVVLVSNGTLKPPGGATASIPESDFTAESG
jgi:hypothetical protein